MENQRAARVKKHLDDMVRNTLATSISSSFVLQRRVELVEQKYYYATLGDKESNPFRYYALSLLFKFNAIRSSLGIVIRSPYGHYHVRPAEPKTDKVKIGS